IKMKGDRCTPCERIVSPLTASLVETCGRERFCVAFVHDRRAVLRPHVRGARRLGVLASSRGSKRCAGGAGPGRAVPRERAQVAVGVPWGDLEGACPPGCAACPSLKWRAANGRAARVAR